MVGSVLFMTQTRRRVVLTGAGGRIGRAITPLLPAQWDVQSTDLTASEGISTLDIGNPDACRAAFAGADAVVHLAAVADPEASWERLLPANVVGLYQVAQTAASCGVRRLVLASSLHTVSATPDQTQVRVTDPPRPGNLYGATKAWAEALGAWVAATTPTSVVALRIGYFAPQPPDAGTVPAREMSSWLSPRDAAELVRAAVEAAGLDFVVANGISANRYRRADLEDTTQRLGYRPVDDAWQSSLGATP
jgi:nucleoside-diphosphate-sugar epimerase